MADFPFQERPGDAGIDPELVSLKPKRAGVGPVLALSIVGLAAYITFQLRADLGYSLQDPDPKDISGIVQESHRIDPAHGNTFVSFQGLPDVSIAGRLRGQQDAGHRLTPVQGTGGHIWIHVPGEAITVASGYESRFTGRARLISDLSFDDDLRLYVAALPPQPHHVFPEALKGGLPATDVLGDPLAPDPTARVVLHEKVPAGATVMFLRTSTVPDQATAEKALARAGITTSGPGVEGDMGETWTFSVNHPGGPEAVRAALRNAGFFGASVQPHLALHEGVVRDLAVAGDAVTLGGTRLPLADVERVVVYTKPVIPAGAMVLLEGESPKGFWYMPYLVGTLALLSAFMLWALLRQLLGRKNEGPPATKRPHLKAV
jgi:hypothetical protein